MQNAARTDQSTAPLQTGRLTKDATTGVTVDFAPVLGKQQRPWDPYWYVYSLAAARFINRSQKLLNLGCGSGASALRLAHLGFQTDACDTDANELTIARNLASRYALDDRCNFKLAAANRIDYTDSQFDLIIGFDALQQLDLQSAINDLHRVLKPGGVAIFKESITTIQTWQSEGPAQALIDQLAKQNPDGDGSNPQLSGEDLRLIHNRFARVETKRFTIFNRLDRLFAARHNAVRAKLRDSDAQLIEICPPLARLGENAVLICYK